MKKQKLGITVGAKIIHENDEYKITKIDDARGIATFENEAKRVLCVKNELVYLEEKKVWFLPGRMELSQKKKLQLQQQ